MRYFLIFWLIPVGGLAAWLYMASNDYSFGTLFFSRDMYDFVFGTYADILGVDPEILPPLVYRALVIDTFIVAAIVAFRRRKEIATWWNARNYTDRLQQRVNAVSATGQVHPAE